jgi:hypothetical protein
MKSNVGVTCRFTCLALYILLLNACYVSSSRAVRDSASEEFYNEILEEEENGHDPNNDIYEDGEPIACTFEIERSTVIHDAGYWREIVGSTHALSTGNAIAVVFDAARVANNMQPEVMFSILSPNADIILSEIKIPDSLEYEPRQHPELASDGSDYAVVWEDTYRGMGEIMMARMTMEGQKIGHDIRLTESTTRSEDPSILFDGREYAIMWFENAITTEEGDLVFLKTDTDGNVLGNSLIIAHVLGKRGHQLLFTGNEFDVIWGGVGIHDNDTFMARLSRDGIILDGPILLTPDWQCSSGFMLPVGSGLAMVCHGDPTGMGDRIDVYFMTFTSEGVKVGGNTKISNLDESSMYPAMVCLDSKLAISWRSDSRSDNLFLGAFTNDGIEVGNSVVLNHGSWAIEDYHMLMAGSNVVVTWSDMEDAYLTMLRCR